MPRKTFLDGDPLPASDVNTYLVNNGYQILDTFYYDASGSFVKSAILGLFPELRAIKVKVQGAGGGGAGCGITGAGQGSVGSGGGGGVYAESFITDIAGLAASTAITIGAGGLRGGGAAGGAAGGESSFGSLVVAPGGGNSSSRTASAFPVLIVGANAIEGGTGDLRIPGEAGGTGIVVKEGQGDGGAGGNSVFGAGGRGAPSGSAGVNGEGYGSGGSGAANSASSAAKNGGNGASGIVIVELYG
jgi:hypothetical protein